MLPAFKVLAKQELISNKKAKELIDKGLVYSKGKKIVIARGEIDVSSKFVITKLRELEIIFENEDILAINKPPFITTSELEKRFSKLTLLHRLDKETSGVLLFTKNDEFRQKAINEFINKKVYKEYVAIISGRLTEDVEINEKIETQKGKFARSKVSDTGKEATSRVSPLAMIGKKTLVRVIIDTGRTHQIRVHLSHIGYSIVGDKFYGDTSEAKRVMLHSKKIELLGLTLEADIDKDFKEFGFDI
jgi:23S rRNA pseudouridine1911/1915/1917 synthase